MGGKMKIKEYVVGPLENNVFLIIDENTKESLLIDPGIESDYILNDINKENLNLKYIINTHSHFDHAHNNVFFKEKTKAKLLIHKDELMILKTMGQQAMVWGMKVPKSAEPDKLLEEGDIIEIGNIKLKVIHTPGHTPGGISLIVDKIAFVGDTIFAGSIGRTDFPGGSFDTLISSIKNKLFILPDDTLLYTGHGPKTTIGEEKKYNPFLN